MLVFGTLCHSVGTTGSATGFSPSLGKASTDCLTKSIASCCLYPSQASVHTHVNVCMPQISRNGMCSLKTVHANGLSVHKVSRPPPAMRNIQKPQKRGKQSKMPSTPEAKTPFDFLNYLLTENKINQAGGCRSKPSILKDIQMKRNEKFGGPYPAPEEPRTELPKPGGLAAPLLAS